jgi:hypothetical protein
VRHYFYFDDVSAARAVARELEALGFTASVQNAAGEDDTWLVLAEPPAGTVEFSRSAFEQLAERHGGEYDGWEAPVP